MRCQSKAVTAYVRAMCRAAVSRDPDIHHQEVRMTLSSTKAAASAPPTPAQNAMKQFSKTPAERGDPSEPADQEQTVGKEAVRAADAGVGESENNGSSPYADRSRPEKAEREQ
jgi:hypothetical protein